MSSRCLDLAEKACLRHSPTHMSGSDSEVYPREFRVAGFLSQSRQRRLPAIGSSQSMNWVWITWKGRRQRTFSWTSAQYGLCLLCHPLLLSLSSFFSTVFYPHWLPFSSWMTETLLPPQGLCTCSYLCRELSPIWFSCAWSFFSLQISVLTLSPNGGSHRLSSAPHLALFPSWHWSWPGVVHHLCSTDTAWQQAFHGSYSLQCSKGLEQRPAQSWLSKRQLSFTRVPACSSAPCWSFLVFRCSKVR